MIDAHRRSIVTPQMKASPETPHAATGDAPFLFPLGMGPESTVGVAFVGFWTRMGSTLKEAFTHAVVNAGSFVSVQRPRIYTKPDVPVAALWPEVTRLGFIAFPPMASMQFRHRWRSSRTPTVHKVAGSVLPWRLSQ